MEAIKLNLVPSDLTKPICHASQFDDGREIMLMLYDGQMPYVLSDEEIELDVKKLDGNIVTTDLTVESGTNYVVMVTTEQMCAIAGRNNCELKVQKDGKTIHSKNFYLAVEESATAGGIESASQINNLQTQIEGMVENAVENQYDSENVIFDSTPTAGHGTGYTVTSEGIKRAIDAAGGGGASIDDTTTASNKTWSSNKINTELGKKPEIDDASTANNKVWSAEKANGINNTVNELFDDVYGGFEPDYQSGSYTENNGKAVHNVTNDWVYVVVDITNLVGKTLTISTYSDRARKILFTDASDNVIDSVLIDTGNPNLYSTVEATVPTGATKCYIDKYASGQNDIAIVGYYQCKLALKSEVPMVDDNFGENENATVSQKFITDNFGNSVEAVIPSGNSKIPVIDEDVPIYLDNLFRGVSSKETRLVDCPNVYVHIYDKTVATLPSASNSGSSGRIKLHQIDDFKTEVFADVPFIKIEERTGSKKVLFIGDSITQNLSYLTPLKDLSDNGNYNITFLGTQGTTIKHEGREGWAAYNYTHDATALGKTNAFWDGEKFNFAWYLLQNNIDEPDYVFINLGTNDLIRGITNPNDDDEVKSVVIPSYETMINSIHSYNANIPIVLWLPPTRCMVGRQNHTGIDNALRINKFLSEKFGYITYLNNKVYLMHTYLFVNPYTDYTISDITINGVTYRDCAEPIHPTQSGGEKIAKGIMRQMKYIDGL